MRKIYSLSLFLLLSIFQLAAQEAKTFQLHSHNDYLQTVPFWTAYSAGATSTLEVLLESMKDYSDILYSKENTEGLKLVISGNRPKTEDYKKYPEWMFFDYQSKVLTKDLPWDKIGMVSLSFRQFSIWNGKGRMVEDQRKGVQDFIDLVHSFDKPVRFWGSPDSKSAWKAFYEMGEDYINTDYPIAAAEYLSNLNENVYQNPAIQEVYQPKFEVDGVKTPVKNVILLLGDGNGLAQISSALFSNGNQLNLTQLKNMGMVKTQAADDFTTDSAAGATAYATGEKTNNRALGVDPGGKVLQNLPDILDGYGISSGIITTDQLTGATPASFYAHHPERDDSDMIAAYLPKSKLDLFIGGGKSSFESEMENLRTAGYTLAESLESIAGDRVGYFAAEGSLPKVQDGRGDYLLKSTCAALQFFEQKKSPFFLMVEAANIDSGGHSNSTSMIVTEMLDFDQVIGEALSFADAHPGTLVLITADHETGGVSIPQGDVASNTVELAYHSDDHTGIMVPIFAYGAHADEFRGVYENTEVFHKILELVKAYH